MPALYKGLKGFKIIKQSFNQADIRSLSKYVLLIPSLIWGLSAFFNILEICYISKCKIDAVIKYSSIDFLW